MFKIQFLSSFYYITTLISSTKLVNGLSITGCSVKVQAIGQLSWAIIVSIFGLIARQYLLPALDSQFMKYSTVIG